MAGAGAALLLLGAAVVHLRRHESKAIGAPMLLALFGAFVAISRFGVVESRPGTFAWVATDQQPGVPGPSSGASCIQAHW